MKFSDGVMLVTYANSLGGDLAGLRFALDRYFNGAVAGLHILPFFPSTSDRGFSPVRYDMVDPQFGGWKDLAGLAGDHYLMYDFMINHVSSRSPQFRDFTGRKDVSPWAGMFIRYKDFWPGGEPTAEDLAAIYKRKPRPPYVVASFDDGTREKVWCTFGDDQIDIDIKSEAAWRFIRDNLEGLAEHGAALIRLDAIAYTTKKIGTPCFFQEPEIWDVLDRVRKILAPRGVEILPEVHEHYTLQLKMAEKGCWVYDFALPMLLLHALYTGETAELVHWLNICPRKQFTTLDTHDGIGIVDVRGLLTEAQIEETKNHLFSQGGSAKMVYSTEVFHNLDLYQINCTYYSALGENDDAYLAARAVQMFAPGIPQVYYVGLLAGKNDIELVEKTRHGRDINRHDYTIEEIDRECERPVVKNILKLLRFRNECPAFTGGCEVTASGSVMVIKRTGGGYTAELAADMKAGTCSVRWCGPDGTERELIR